MTSAITADRSFNLVYGLAHGGKSLFWHSSELLFAFFLTEACGLSPRQMGLVLGASLAVSAGTDLAVGFVLGRRVQDARAAGVYQLTGMLLSAAAFWAFTLTATAPQGAIRLALALVALIAFRASYSLVDVPQNALLGLATRSDGERAVLSSVRYVFGGLANIIVAMAFAPMFQMKAGRSHPETFIIFAILIGLAATISAAGLWARLRWGEHIEAVLDPSDPHRRPALNKARLGPVLSIMFLITAATSIFSRLEPYFAAYGLGPALQGGAILTCVALGSVASQPFWALLARSTSLGATFACACTALVVGSAAFDGLVLRGVALGALGAALYGCGSGGVLMSLWALAASGAGARATISFGALTCVSKLALALSAFLAGELLNGGAYRSAIAAREWVLPAMAAATGLAGAAALSVYYFVLLRRSMRI